MKILSAGEYIKEERIKQGLKQKELCSGLCSQVTLSRIETGSQSPNIRTLNALLERLGLPSEKFYAIRTEEEKRVDNLMKEIVRCCDAGDRQNGLRFIADLEKMTNPKERLVRQFLLHSRGILGTEEGAYPFEEKLEILMEAIHITVPGFSGETIANHRYTLEEMNVIGAIARTYSEQGEHRKALNILRECYEYVEKYHKNITKSAGLYPYVTFWYAAELGACGFYKESIECAELGRQSCIKYAHFQMLGRLLHTKAESYRLMGDDENGKKQYLLAWSLYCALDDKDNKLKLVRDAKKYYDIDLETGAGMEY